MASVIGGTVRARAWDGQTATMILPVDVADDLGIEDRIVRGDRYAVIDAIRDAEFELGEVARQMSDLLTDGSALLRLAEVRRRQAATGRQWHGAEISGPIQETGATDRTGQEPRGPRRRQDRSRQATAGKSAKKRSRRC